MTLPLLCYLFAFTLVPLLASLKMSITAPEQGGFPSGQNFRYLLSHGQFDDALFNTIAITLLGLCLQLVVGMILALMMHRTFWGRGLIRTIVLIPMGVPTIVSGVIFTYVFDIGGYLNELLFRLGEISHPIDWQAGGLRTILSVVFADMWKVTPLVTLILLAGLESIPEEVYEAGAVDGVTPLSRFFFLTLPLLKPSITMAVILRAIDAFRIFEIPLILTGKTTPVLATFAYFEYYEYNNPYTSAAAATLLTAIILGFILLYLFLVERKES
ncbi:MAG: sugar ABC transporter permease [Nitrospinota bacterium]|nr:MAG: sugar ABC transporter permease [Nitrospinota bacterium]